MISKQPNNWFELFEKVDIFNLIIFMLNYALTTNEQFKLVGQWTSSNHR